MRHLHRQRLIALLVALLVPALAQAAELGHAFAEQTTRQTTSSTSYTAITGASISSASFTTGKKYLLIFSAEIDNSSTNGLTSIRAVHGSTAFTGSDLIREPGSGTATRNTYAWFTVWTAVASEGVGMEFAAESPTTAGADQLTIAAIKLSDDLTENTDWFFNENTTSTTLSSTWSTSNNATATFTPAGASTWMVLTTARLDPVGATISYRSRINRSGEASSTLPNIILEPDDAAGEFFVETNLRAFSLTAVSNTFAEQSSVSTTGTTEARTYSALFALNLNKLRNSANVYTEAGVDLSATDFATAVQTTSITPAVAGDVLILGFWVEEVTASVINAKSRLQVDNVDQPATQTTDAYVREISNDARDWVPLFHVTMENLTAAAHTLDVDGSTNTATAGRSADQRSIVAFTMELPAAGAARRIMVTQ